jgi:hypothetical protein
VCVCVCAIEPRYQRLLTNPFLINNFLSYAYFCDLRRPWQFFYCAIASPSEARPPRRRGFAIILRHFTLDRTLLDELSAQRINLYLTSNNTHKRQTSMPPGGIRTCNPSKLVAANPRLRPQCHRDPTAVSLRNVALYNDVL